MAANFEIKESSGSQATQLAKQTSLPGKWEVNLPTEWKPSSEEQLCQALELAIRTLGSPGFREELKSRLELVEVHKSTCEPQIPWAYMED